MFLSIYVYRRLGLTLDLREEQLLLPSSAVREGPAFDRLTVIPANLRDPVRLNHWLSAFVPENGAAVPYRLHAQRQWERHAVGTARMTAASILWGNADSEYTGAIDFRQTGRDADEELPPRGVPDLEPITEEDIGRRLALATRISVAARKTRPHELLDLPGRRVSLSGMRGKLSLTRLADGRWAYARGDTLNTWIVKHEEREDLRGEAGVESVCQRALRLIRVPAAVTRACVFGGRQAIVSKRTDRSTDDHGRIEARHQEEWIQAAGLDPADKYDQGRRDEPRWPGAHRLLAARATDPERAHAGLVRALAGTWLLGHCDLHRRNLGFLHAPADQPAAVSLAPLYDVSSSLGTEYATHLAIAIDRVTRLHRVSPLHWIRHGEACGIAPDITVATLDELFRTLPDAILTAQGEAREDDENLHPEEVDTRVGTMLAYVQARHNAWRQEGNRLARRGRGGIPPAATALAGQLRKAIARNPGGTVHYTADAQGDRMVLAYEPPEGEQIPIGAAASPRQAAVIVAAAGGIPPEDIPRLERTLEQQRQLALAQARQRTPG